MKKIVKNLNGSYSFIDDEKNIVIDNLKSVFDKRKNCSDIKIPEIDSSENYPKWLSESKFKDGIVEIEILPKSVNSSSRSLKNEKITLNWIDFIDENDKNEFERIKSIAITKMNHEMMMRTYQEKLKEIERMKNELGIE